MAPQESAPVVDQLQLPDEATTPFSQYPEYKDSGLEWLGPVPQHWVYGRTDRYLAYRKEQVNPESLRDEIVAYYSIPNFQAYGTYALEEPRNINSDKLRIKGGELIVSKLNPRKNSVILTEPCEYTSICSTEFVPMIPERVDPRYALYFYKSEYVRQTLDARVESVTRSHQRADPDQILKIWTYFPPLDEQRAIAAFLDRETAKIDALIERKGRASSLTAERRLRVIDAAVTGKTRDDKRKRQAQVEWLDDVPEHWLILPIKRVSDTSYGLGQPPTKVEEGVPFIRATDVHDGKISLDAVVRVNPKDETIRTSARLNGGEILVVRSGAYTGDTSFVPTDLAGSIAGYDLILRPKRIDPEFLAWQLLASHIQRFQFPLEKMRAAQPHINAEEVGATKIIVPPMEEQREIVREIQEQLDPMEKLDTSLNRQIAYLREYRTALISAAVTGQIDVRGRV